MARPKKTDNTINNNKKDSINNEKDILDNEIKEKKTRNGKNKHHGGYAGDGQDLVPLKGDGTPAKYDKYGNLVTPNTGKGKGIVLKEYYNCANKNIQAPMPQELIRNLTRPYHSINDMPIDYIYNSIVEYFISLTEPVYKQVQKLDENDNPIKKNDGTYERETKLVGCNYKNVPTMYGLAQALGVEVKTLYDYLNTKQFNDNTLYDTNNINNKQNGYSNHRQSTLPNSRNKIVDLDNINDKNTIILYNIYGDSIFEDRNRVRTEKDYKIDLLKRARTEVLKYHEQRLGTNENVSGSMFALLNSKDGWTNEHKVSIEIPSLLGGLKSQEELDKLGDDGDNVILVEEKDGVFVVPKDIDF